MELLLFAVCKQRLRLILSAHFTAKNHLVSDCLLDFLLRLRYWVRFDLMR